jgi:hypothetical protein
MKYFRTYLLNRQLASEKSASYYVSWVSKGYAFADKAPGASLSAGEVDKFLRHPARSCDE